MKYLRQLNIHNTVKLVIFSTPNFVLAAFVFDKLNYEMSLSQVYVKSAYAVNRSMTSIL